MKRQHVHGHDKQSEVPASSGESSPRRMTERLNMLMTFPMATCLARLQAQQAAGNDAGKAGGRLVEAVVAKMVLIVLGDFHGVDGRIYPSIETIAQMASISGKSAERAVKTLELLGLVNVIRRNRDKGAPQHDRTNWYVLKWDAIAEHGNRPTVASQGDEQATDQRSVAHDGATDPRSGALPTNGRLGNRPTVASATDPRSVKPHNTTEELNCAIEPHRAVKGPSRAGPGESGPSRAENWGKAPKAGVGCEVVTPAPRVQVEIETPIATLHRLHKREKAQNLLLNIGVRKSALGELLDHAEQEDPKGEGNPLPRVMAVLDACQKNKRCRSPIGWVTQAINEHWDLNALPGESQHRKAGAA